MIQRIQTLFLFLSIMACALLFFFPIAVYHNPLHGTYKLFATHMIYVDAQAVMNFLATSPMLILLIGSMLLSLVAIFTFKKRKLQLLFVNLNILFTIALVALIFLFYADHFFRDNVQVQPTYQFGGFAPLISLVFLILSFRAIRKDEALLKSSERLR